MSSESSEISTLTPSQEDDDAEKGNNSDEAEEEGVEDQNVNAANEDVNGLALAETPEPVDPMVVEASMSPATPPAPQENEFDYEEEEDAIHLDHNDDMNYEEDGGNDDQEEEEDMSSLKPQNEEDYGNNASTPNDRFGELQGEDISAGESDEEDKGEIRETNFEVENKMNAAKEEEIDAGSDEDEEEGELENLEEGEIIDSDDGIPEIKGSMSPPEMADDFSKSFDNHIPAYDNTGNGGGGYPQQQHFDQQPQYEHREREQCRFYIRGNCRNGDACRFKHTFSTNARVQFQSKSNSARPSNYNIPVPPPTGPPIPLLSTEFAPPPSLALPIVRPSGPVNVDSAAWEQGLKKAREIVRRQQKTETKEEEEGKEEKEEDRKSEDLSFGGKGFEKAELANAEAEEPTSRHFHQQHRQQQYPSNVQQPHQNHHHRPIASRMVVEYVSVVTSPSVGGGSYGQRRSGNNDKSKVSIPSLIDNIIDKPMSPPRERAPPMSLKTKQRDRDGRRTFESSNYSDPWARQNSSGGDYESGKRNGRTNSGRKRRRSSSAGSSSSSDGKPAKRRAHRTPSSPAHHHRQEDGRTNHHQHSTGQQSRHHNSSSRRVSNELPGRKETTSTERGEERKKIKEENDSGKAKLGRNDSASSRTSISSSKKRALRLEKAPSSRSSSVSSTTSTSTDSSREATLGSLLKTHPTDKMTASQQSSSAKSKGPKTPPTPADLQRPSSESSTTASSSSCSRNQENRKKQSGNERPISKHVDKSANIQSRQNSAKLDQQRRFSRGSNQSIKNDGKRRHSQQQQVPRRSSMLKNEEDDEEEDAPAAYRISRKPSSNADSKRKRGGGGDRESSTSSLSSSSSSSSDSSSNSSALGRDGKRKPSAGDGKTMVTICSSERNVRIPVPSLDDKVDPISSDDEDAADERKNSLGGIAKQIVGRTNSEDNEEAKGVNDNAADGENQSTSASNVQKSSKEESSRKRKLELLQKLQSVEKAIARKKQQMDGGMEE